MWILIASWTLSRNSLLGKGVPVRACSDQSGPRACLQGLSSADPGRSRPLWMTPSPGFVWDAERGRYAAFSPAFDCGCNELLHIPALTSPSFQGWAVTWAHKQSFSPLNCLLQGYFTITTEINLGQDYRNIWKSCTTFCIIYTHTHASTHTIKSHLGLKFKATSMVQGHCKVTKISKDIFTYT